MGREAVAFCNVVLPVPTKDHVDDCKNSNIRFLLYPEEIVLLKFLELLVRGIFSDVIKSRDQESASPTCRVQN